LTTSENQNNICAVIPFFNEEKHIKFVISEVIKYVDVIIMVNDGSNDLSMQRIPNDDKIIILQHKSNLGKGKALRTGIEKSFELGSAITITLDADNQHDPKKIPQFIEAVKNFDFAIGCRKREKSKMPFHRVLSNYLTSKLLSIKTGRRIIDSQSGYRVFKTEISPDILPIYSGFEAESEMIVKACKNNYSVGFVDIPTLYGNDTSKMRMWPTIIGFIKVLIKT